MARAAARKIRNLRTVPRIVLLIESSRFSGRSLLLGIAEYARHHGPWAFYWQPGGFEKARPRVGKLDADGIILRDVEMPEAVLSSGIPAIVVGHNKQEVPGVSNVITDSQSIARMAAEHLVDCGFRHFGFVGFKDLPWSVQRGDAFAGAIAAAGFRAERYEPKRSGGGWGVGQAEMAVWLKQLPKPVGIMGCNDDRGESVIEACKLAALRVPDEVGIIGADNDELVCELSDPPMSSVAINFQRAGYETAQLLGSMMAAGRSNRIGNIIVQPTHVVARQSTDLVFMEDTAVARSLRFIRQNARRSISVADIAAAIGLSRRVLEKRFRRAVGRSILGEVKRVRAGQIARMLVETNHSISEIAFAMGFNGIEHIARYFRQEKQMTPLAYRRKFGPK